MTSNTRRYDRMAADLRRPPAAAGGALDVLECVRLGVLAASSHNTQPWRFRTGPDWLEIRPDLARRCPVVDPDDSHLYKSLGCAVENVVHAASAQGHAAEIEYDAEADRIRVCFRRARAAIRSELAEAIVRRQCNKLPYDGRPVPLAALARLEEAGRGGGVRTVLVTDRPRLESVVEFVTAGNRLQLEDAAFRRELLEWVRFNPAAALRHRDGLAGRVGGQPSVPDWLGPRIAPWVLSARGQAATDARNLRSSAGVAVTVAESDDRAAWIEAGRAWERFALQAAALDIRTAFVNQPVEVRALRPQLASWLGLAREHPLLIVRFGYGPLAPYSLRRPLEEVLDVGATAEAPTTRAA